MPCIGATSSTCSEVYTGEPRKATLRPTTDLLPVLDRLQLEGDLSNQLTVSWDTSASYADQQIRAHLRQELQEGIDVNDIAFGIPRDSGGIIFSDLVVGEAYALLLRVEDADEANQWDVFYFTYEQATIVDPNQVLFAGRAVTHQGTTITS